MTELEKAKILSEEFEKINKLEIKKIEITSPIEGLNIGEDFFYKGMYITGYEEGVSKIKRIYKEVPFWNGKERKVKKNGVGGHPIWMELENSKLVLLGFLEYKDKFSLNEFEYVSVKSENFK